VRRHVAVGLFAICLVRPVIAGPWNPTLRFSIEDASYEETLIFVSGMANALAYSTRELAARKERNFFCLPRDRILDTRLLVDLVNAHLAGPQTAEALADAVIKALAGLRHDIAQ
jgi:hypothetical protein